jgi:hypothetical protein
VEIEKKAQDDGETGFFIGRKKAHISSENLEKA